MYNIINKDNIILCVCNIIILHILYIFCNICSCREKLQLGVGHAVGHYNIVVKNIKENNPSP